MILDLLIPLAKPPWTTLGKSLESRVRKAIYDFELLEPGVEKIAIALSGGKEFAWDALFTPCFKRERIPPFRDPRDFMWAESLVAELG